MVQQVDGQWALPANKHVAQEIQSAATQVPRQVVLRAQPGELEVEYIYFCRLCFLHSILENRVKDQHSSFSSTLFTALKFISALLLYFRVAAAFVWVAVCC